MRGGNVVQFPVGMCLQLVVVCRLPCEPSSRCAPPLVVHLSHALHHLKESCASADAVCFQRRRYRQADGLLGAAYVGHDKIGGQGVKSPVHTFHRSVKRLQVNGDILPFLHYHPFAVLLQRYEK